MQQGGTVELTATSADVNSYILFDDLAVEQTGGMIVQEQHTYGYGAPLTGLNYVIGTKRYRHGYQGQFTEKDEETGWDGFELRQFDLRIGRWMAPDPMGQFHSPYVGMGNNPVSDLDPDGGLALDPIIRVVGNGLLNQSYKVFINLGSIGNALTAVGSAIIKGVGPVGLQAGVGGIANATRAFQQKYNTSAGEFYTDEFEAYKAMVNDQSTYHHETMGWLVFDN